MHRLWTASLAAIALAACVLPVPAQPETIQRDGAVFTRSPWGVERPKPELSDEEQKQGFVTFIPSDLDGIGPLCYPTRAEISARAMAFASPGEFEPVTFGIYAATDLKNVAVQAGQFIGGRRGRIGPANLDIRAVRVWPQRTSWGSDRYYVIPELLEKSYEADIPAGTMLQYWVTIHVPADAGDGAYEGYVRITVDGQHHMLPIQLRVLPFAIKPVEGKAFGLWSDSARWANYGDEQILDEIGSWRDHGINCAIMYPLTHGKFALENGELKADLREFERVMNLYVRAGMGGPVVASCQGIAAMVHKLLGLQSDDYGPKFSDLMLRIVKAIEDLRVSKGWPEFVYHTVDEPGGHTAVQAEAEATLSILHRAGYKTFTTADVDYTNRALAPYLDVRCYGIGDCARSAQQADARRVECAASGATYWWYGTGCYTGQEGSTAVNRHLGGFLLDKSLATGAWAWTFQRPKGSAYDDFDGADAAEPKDACITYPAPDGGPPLVPTLQWEGIREGIDDLRYLQNLRSAIADLRATKGRNELYVADRAERELTQLLDRVPWLDAGGFTSSQAQAMRWRIASLTMECAAALTKSPLPTPPAIVVPRGASKPTVSCAFSEGAPPPPAPPIPVAYARRVAKPPTIDGVLDRTYVQAYQTEPFLDPTGAEAPVLTRAWICRDADNLYVAIWCEESQMDKIRAAVKDHDGQVWTDDSVELFVDADADPATYRHFTLNSIGTSAESLCTLSTEGAPEGPTDDRTWDGPWQGAAGPCDGGWCAEFAIPLDTVGGRQQDTWSVNINRTRRVEAVSQYCCWSPTLGGYHVPSRFGRVCMVPGDVEITSVQLPHPQWTRCEAVVRVANPGMVAEVDTWTYAGDSRPSSLAPVRFLLSPGQNELVVDYAFKEQGLQNVRFEMQARSVWVDRAAAEVVDQASGDTWRGGAQGLQGRVRPLEGRPVALCYPQLVPAPLVVTAAPAELLTGQPGFNVEAAVAMGPQWGRAAKLLVSVLRGQETLVSETVRGASGDRVFISVGTGLLPPGDYRVQLAVERGRETLSAASVPFSIAAGPWVLQEAQ